MKTNSFETPPTAGLPLQLGDWTKPQNMSLVEQISAYFSLPPLQLTCSGTAAQIIALKTLSQTYPEKKQVIIPAYTCPLVAMAIHHCGLEVQLCDIMPESFELDIVHLQQLMNEQVLAIMPTHLGGQVADIATIKNIAQQFKAFTIEDAAQALGAGVGKQGDIVFFSLAAGKGLTLYEGGLLTSPDDDLRHALEKTSKTTIPQSKLWSIRRTVELLGYTLLYRPWGLQFVYGTPRRKALKRNDLLEAVGDIFDFNIPIHTVNRLREKVGSNAFGRFPDFLSYTRQQAEKRLAMLNHIKGITIVQGKENNSPTWPFFMVLAPNANTKQAILDQLWKTPLGVSCLFMYSLPDYDYLKPIVPQHPQPNAQDFAARMFTISNSLWLSDEQFDFILETISKVLVN